MSDIQCLHGDARNRGVMKITLPFIRQLLGLAADVEIAEIQSIPQEDSVAIVLLSARAWPSSDAAPPVVGTVKRTSLPDGFERYEFSVTQANTVLGSRALEMRPVEVTAASEESK